MVGIIIVSDADLERLKLALIDNHALVKSNLQELPHNIITAFLVLKTHISTITIPPNRLILCKRILSRVIITL